jgi:hypothetical protein
MKKNVIVAILVIIVLVLPVFTAPYSVFASPGYKVPSWAVYSERMADSSVWHADAKGEIRQFKSVEVGDRIPLVNARGETFLAEITEILSPIPASNPRNPSMVWAKYSADSSYNGIAIVCKKWGPF